VRFKPVGPASAYRTFSIKAPIGSHFRPATCEEVGCPNYLHGWRIRVEGLEPQLLHTAKNSGRKYSVLEIAANEHWLVYEAGQPCFQQAAHRTRLERPELYVVRDGDHRGNPLGTARRVHKNAEEWAEDLHEHTDKILDALKEG
jgi:hypothetical protein